MKVSILIILCASVLNSSTAQSNKAWLQDWQKATVSLGNIKYDTFLVDGKKKEKPYYNILGTAVVFYVKNSPFPVIVTAKHVLQDETGNLRDSIRMRFSWEDDKSIFQFFGHRIDLKFQGNNLIFTHPTSDMDLAAFPARIQKPDTLSQPFKMVRYDYFAKADSYEEGLDVYVLGYPGSVGKTYWTRALVRKGIISFVPSKEAQENKILIDANVYPGNSGGPVISQIPLIQFRDTTESELIKDYLFLGIVIERKFDYSKIATQNNQSVYDSAGIVITSKNKAVAKTPSNFLLSKESIGIAVVEPAQNVLSLLLSLDDAIKTNR